MPVLPSGKVVGIMSERARFHAARLRLHVTEATAHRDLYPLIDILIEEPDTPGSSTGFNFSGYTLGDTRQLNQWPEHDRHFFMTWLRQPAQIRTIEMARQRLLLEQGAPKERVYPYPDRLYSLLAARLEALPMRQATVMQWKRTLLNMRRSGVRNEELDWSGLPGFLAAKPSSQLVRRDELMAAIDFMPIQLKLSHELECNRNCQLPFQEVAQRLPAYLLRLAGYQVADNDVGVVRLRVHNPNYRIGLMWPGGHAPLNGQQWFVLGAYGQAIALEGEPLFYASQEQAIQSANQHALRNHALRCDLVPRERYEYMTLHGGDSYREWLVTLPNYTDSLFNGHFHERNVLLHMRTKTRTSESGYRVLFIEELQSDWHQLSERSRRFEEIPHAPFRKEWVSLALKMLLLHVVEQGLDGIAWADVRVHEMRYDKPLAPLRRLYDDELPRALLRLAKPWQGALQRGEFVTRSPWLHAARHKELWRVEGGAGRFVTRARFDKSEALAIIERHSKAVTLELPLLLLPEAMRDHLAEHGMPLFGECYR